MNTKKKLDDVSSRKKSEVKRVLEKNPEKIYELIEEDQEEKKQLIEIMRAEFFSGPLPHLDILLKYKEIDEEFPNRILKLVENQSQHRMNLETKSIDADIKLEHRGQDRAFILFFILIVGSFTLIYFDKGLGLHALIGTLVTGVITFLGSKRKQVKEIEIKDSKMKNNKPED